MKNINKYKIAGCILLAAIALVTVALQYTINLSDNDIWFTMAYGRYFLEQGTIIADHGIFSWTPAVNSTIYCTWVSSIFYVLLYKAGGITTLFTLRYVCVLAFILIALSFAPKKHMAAIPLAVLILLVGAKMATSGIRIKAELFSFIFMTAMVWVWFRVKSSSRDPGETGRYLWYVYPVLMLFWVNSHGGFIFGLAFLATLGGGEAMNRLTGSAQMLAPQTRRHLFTAIVLSFMAVLFNPYGWAYPGQLLDSLILNPGEFSRHVKTVMEYQTIFFPAARHLLFMDAMAIAVCILLPLLAVHFRKHRPDWTMVLFNALFMIIYMRYLRTTYFWGIIFVFTALYLLKEACRSHPGLLSEKPRSYWLQALIVCALLVFSARADYYALVSPDFGFRVNYQNTFTEAEFIRKNFPDLKRMGNDYNPGAYLIWALGPEKKVLIDSRYFPYADWYDEYNEFFTTKDGTMKKNFLKKYSCDLWVLTYDSPHLQYFLSSPDWRLVYYGPSACVFVSAGLDYPDGVKAAGSISKVSFYQALLISPFALKVKDYGLAMDLLTNLKPLPFSKDQKSFAVGALGKAGDTLFSDNQFSAAQVLYEKILTIDPGSARAYLMMGRLHLKMNNNEEAIRCFRESVRRDPRSLQGLNYLANTYVLINRPGEAVKEYAKAREIDPAHAGIQNGLNMAQQRITVLESQIAQVDEALKSQPDNLKLLNTLGVYSAMAGHYEKAAASFKKVADMKPDDPEIYYNIACMYSMLDRVDESRLWIERAMEKGFDNWALLRGDPDLENFRTTDFYKGMSKK